MHINNINCGTQHNPCHKTSVHEKNTNCGTQHNPCHKTSVHEKNTNCGTQHNLCHNKTSVSNIKSNSIRKTLTVLATVLGILSFIGSAIAIPYLLGHHHHSMLLDLYGIIPFLIALGTFVAISFINGFKNKQPIS